MSRDFENKVVWITGSARGIGKSIAEEFASQGASLALTDVLEEQLKITADELSTKYHIPAITHKLDVTSSAGASDFVQRCVSELGGLTVLVNNAGVTRDNLLMRMSDDEWDLVLSVNLKGTYVCTKAATKVMMKARYGKVINISSVVGVMGNAGQANYSASKAGMIGFTKSIAKELGGRGVRVNAVAPGFIVTDMTKELTPEIKEAYLKAIPLNLLGQPKDVAKACIFLASPESDYITGQVLQVDGGMRT